MVTVTCSPNKMVVALEKASMPGIDENFLQLLDSSCSLTANATHIVVVTSFTACGTKLQVCKNIQEVAAAGMVYLGQEVSITCSLVVIRNIAQNKQKLIILPNKEHKLHCCHKEAVEDLLAFSYLTNAFEPLQTSPVGCLYMFYHRSSACVDHRHLT